MRSVGNHLQVGQHSPVDEMGSCVVPGSLRFGSNAHKEIFMHARCCTKLEYIHQNAKQAQTQSTYQA